MKNYLKLLVILLSSVCLFLTVILINYSENTESQSTLGDFIIESVEVVWAENIDEADKQSILDQMQVDEEYCLNAKKELIEYDLSQLKVKFINFNEVELVDSLYNRYERLYYTKNNSQITIYKDKDYTTEGTNIFEIGSKFIIEKYNTLTTVYISEIFEVKLILTHTNV